MAYGIWARLSWYVVILGLAGSVGFAGELTGRQIIEKQQDHHMADNEYAQIKLTLVDRKGKEKHQELVIYTAKREEKTRTLIQYHAPANIRGVSLLTWEQGKDKEDDQWLYMSASRSTKRIAGGSKKNQFMGTDIAFEDIRSENLDAHTYTRKADAIVFDKKCWEIESVPSTKKEKTESGYGKRVMWVDPANYVTLKVDYYDPHGRHIKTAVFEDVRPMGKKMYRSFKVTWNRIRQKTTTIMIYEKIDLDTRQKDILFTQNYMKRPVR